MSRRPTWKRSWGTLVHTTAKVLTKAHGSWKQSTDTTGQLRRRRKKRCRRPNFHLQATFFFASCQHDTSCYFSYAVVYYGLAIRIIFSFQWCQCKSFPSMLESPVKFIFNIGVFLWCCYGNCGSPPLAMLTEHHMGWNHAELILKSTTAIWPHPKPDTCTGTLTCSKQMQHFLEAAIV